MKRLIFIVLIMLPALSYSQLSDDGKTFSRITNKQNTYTRANTILVSGVLYEGILPGIKYQYCKSFGAYASFKSLFGEGDRGNTLITIGPAKSIGKQISFYLGGGINFVRNFYYDDGAVFEERYPLGLIEGGFIFKLNKFAIDVGGGLVIERLFYGNLGLGFNF